MKFLRRLTPLMFLAVGCMAKTTPIENPVFSGTASGTLNLQGSLSTNQSVVINRAVSNPAPYSSTLLHLTQSDALQGGVLIDTFGTNATVTGRRAEGTSIAPTAVQSGQSLLGISGHGRGSSTYSSNTSHIIIRSTENWTDASQGTRIDFNVVPNGTAASVNALIIDQDKSANFFGLMVANRATAAKPVAIPDSLFQLVGPDATNALASLDAFGGNPVLAFRRADGTSASPSAVQSGDIIGLMSGRGYGVTGYGASGTGAIYFVATENFTDSAQGTKTVIEATANGSVTRGTAIDIRSDGIAVPNGLFRVDSDFVKSADTALANVTGLSITVVSGQTYLIRCCVNAVNSTTGGYKWSLGGTATATSVNGTIVSNVNDATATTWSQYQSQVTALNSFFGAVSTAGIGTSYHVIEFVVVVNAGGTITLQFAQNSAAGTSTVKTGSYMWAQRF